MLRTTEVVVEPEQYDILCGKDKECISHFGSVHFREVIEGHRIQYQQATTKQEKMDITRNIVVVLNLLSCRFLKYNSQLKGWQEISHIAARDKVSHALRFANRNNIKSRIAKKATRNYSPTKLISNCDIFVEQEKKLCNNIRNNNRSSVLPVIDIESSRELADFHDDVFRLPSSIPDSSSLISWFEEESNP